MIGLTIFDKSRLSTSKRKTSNSTSTYQQLEKRNLLATFVVTTTEDIVADDGLVSLREAVTAANLNASFSDVVAGDETGDRIVFAPQVRESTFVVDSELPILDDLVIRGYETPEGFDTHLEPQISGNRIFYIDTTERVYFRDVELWFGRADQGGLVKVNAGGNVTFESSLLHGGSADQGGGIYATDSRLVFDGTRIVNNKATDTGGGIWADGGEVILLDQSLLKENEADEGGGAFVDNGTQLYAANSNFEVNSSWAQGGGAIWAGADTSIQIKSSVFEFNGADLSIANPDDLGSIKGGAIASFGESLRVVESRFQANRAEFGGAVYSAAVSSTFVESDFEQNLATRSGGAAWFFGEEARLIDGRVANNSATERGGGLYFGSNASLVGIVRNVEVSSNTATSGGGISVRGVDVRVLNSTISDNIARRRGGGIDLGAAKLYAFNTTFASNSIDGGSGEGGAISTHSSLSFIDSSTFNNNLAAGGGGIATRGLNDTTFRSTSFKSNVASSGGAAVMIGGNGVVRSFDSTFESNTSGGSGGAILVLGTGRLISRDTSFAFNTATSEGGAISSYGTVNVANTIFEGNRAKRGGAIKVGGAGGLLSIERTTRFSSNIATANGSAISSTSSSITLINDAEFNDNVVEDGFGDLLFVGDVTFHRVTNSDLG